MLDFPSSPTPGQSYGNNWRWDGTKWGGLGAAIQQPGDWQLIKRIDITGSQATVDFIGFDNTYDEYEVAIIGALASADAALYLRVSQDNGATWLTAGNYQWAAAHAYAVSTSSALTGNAGAAQSQLGPTFQHSAGFPIYGKVWVAQPWATGNRKTFQFHISGSAAGNGFGSGYGSAGFAGNASPVNGVRFYPSSGNWVAGTFCLYGRSKTPTAPPLPPGGTPILLQRIDVTSPQATVDFISGIDGTYDEYEVHYFGVKLSTATALMTQVSQDAGATWKTAAADYLWDAVYSNYTIANSAFQGSGGGGAAFINLTGSHVGIGTNANAVIAGKLWAPQPSTSGVLKVFKFESRFYQPTQGMATWAGGGHLGAAGGNAAFNGLRFGLTTAGTINAGTFLLYGISKNPVTVAGMPGGQLVQIMRQDAVSGVLAVDFTSGIDNTYDEYEVHLYNVKPNVDAGLLIRISQDGGATWKNGSTDYSHAIWVIPAIGAQALIQNTTTYMQVTSAQMASTAANGAGGIVRFFLPGQSGLRKTFQWDITGQNAAAGMTRYAGGGTYGTDQNAINGIRFQHVTNNFLQGTLILYGVKKQ